MFGGFDHLSRAEEEATRRQREQARADAAAAAADTGESLEELLEKLKLTTDEGRASGPISREEFLNFFASNEQELTSPETRARFKRLARTLQGKLELNELMVAMQRSHFTELGINQDYGCEKLGAIASDYPEDTELAANQSRFIQLCHEAFLTALRDSRPQTLQTSGSLSKEQIFLFVDACQAYFTSAEGRQRLKQEADRINNMPNQVCVEMQHEMLEVVGVQRTWGVGQLARFQQTFSTDQELQAKMSTFMQMCQMAVARATMSKEQMETMQKRNRAEMRRMAEEQQSGGRTEGKVTKEEMLEFFALNTVKLASEETRTKLKKLAQTEEGRGDLNRVLVDIQRSVFTDMDINRSFGVECLNGIATDFPDDRELHTALKVFAEQCSKAYVTAVKDAKIKSKTATPNKLSRGTILCFVDCVMNTFMQPETRAALRAHFVETGELPNKVVDDIQRELFQALAIDPEHGANYLANTASKDYSKDQEVLTRLGHLQAARESYTQKARLSDEEALQAEREELLRNQAAARRQASVQNAMQQVQLAIQNMSEAEKEALKAKMLPRWRTIMKLPLDERMQYLQRQTPTDQQDFAKINTLMTQEAMSQNPANPQQRLQELILGTAN